jgi:L-glutamine-phosphate cytidylyltransferase
MRGIIIAAGRGMRLRPLTQATPKCMLPICDRPLLHKTMDNLRAAGCDEIVIVAGHCAEQIDAHDATIVVNEDFENNNILHSLMYAEDYIDGPVMCSYSDIWVEAEICQNLASTKGDVVISVDRDWTPYYEGRSDHPVEEAENVVFDDSNLAWFTGKDLEAEDTANLNRGEFLGLWYLSEQGSHLWRSTFNELSAELDMDEQFIRAQHWRNAYITDFLQYLINKQTPVSCSFTDRGWAEIDTLQDFERIYDVASLQRLHSISRYTSPK